jgi:hypothetical protein
MKQYKAPWGTSLVILSLLVTVVCLGVSVVLWLLAAPKLSPGLARLLPLLPVLLVLGSALFTIRGYTVTPEAILVHRLLWDTWLPRVGLESAQVEPEAMRGSLRTFGNGGGFSFTGFYWNKRLGSYRAFVTDLRRTVVLRYAGRRIVLSPELPEDFVRELAVPTGNT